MLTTVTNCPVCGYDALDALVINDAPYLDGSVCPSCGTEFSYSDVETTHEQLRQRWIQEKHAEWWSRFTSPPRQWSPVMQLNNINYRCTPDDIRAIRGGTVGAATRFPVDASPATTEEKQGRERRREKEAA